MPDWLVGLAVDRLIASWGLLAILARRLPPGVLRDLAAFIPDCLTQQPAAPTRAMPTPGHNPDRSRYRQPSIVNARLGLAVDRVPFALPAGPTAAPRYCHRHPGLAASHQTSIRVCAQPTVVVVPAHAHGTHHEKHHQDAAADGRIPQRSHGGAVASAKFAIAKLPISRDRMMRRRRVRPPAPTSEFAGFRFPPEVIVWAVRWYPRFAARGRRDPAVSAPPWGQVVRRRDLCEGRRPVDLSVPGR